MQKATLSLAATSCSTRTACRRNHMHKRMPRRRGGKASDHDDDVQARKVVPRRVITDDVDDIDHENPDA